MNILSPEQIKRGISETVYVVASGPNGEPHWHKIPHGAFVIVVNRAINIPDIPKTWWICEDDTLPDQKWFGIAYAGNHAAASPIPFVTKQGGRIDDEYFSDYIFMHTAIWDTAIKRLGREPDWNAPNTYGGATVACRAVQIAALRGAREIILVGVDMAGSFHFDGDEGECEREIRRRGEWQQAERFDKILEWIIRKTGIEIFTLSETKLAVPIRSDAM
jgi:hypothetical protein